MKFLQTFEELKESLEKEMEFEENKLFRSILEEVLREVEVGKRFAENSEEEDAKKQFKELYDKIREEHQDLLKRDNRSLKEDLLFRTLSLVIEKMHKVRYSKVKP